MYALEPLLVNASWSTFAMRAPQHSEPLVKSQGFIAVSGRESIEVSRVALVRLPYRYQPVVEIAPPRASKIHQFSRASLKEPQGPPGIFLC